MTDCLFVDVSTLNVLFMVDGKFSLGMNYSSFPEKLAMDAQALGSSYDVYLSMWPRQQGEGDIEIPKLMCGDIPFYALRVEIDAVFSLIKKIPGVNTIYLCNTLDNFIRPARVDNFTSVLCYGNRFVQVKVKNRKPYFFEVFRDQQEFRRSKGEDYSCYGDMDLVDVDNLRSQHPELESFKRSMIVPLTPLISSYQGLCKLTIDDVYENIVPYIREEDEPKEVPKKVTPKKEPTKQPVVEEPKPVKEVHGKVDWLIVAMCLVICACAGVVGYGYQFRDAIEQAESYISSASVYDGEAEYQRYLQNIYTNSEDMSGRVADILAFAKQTELNVTVSAVDAFNDRVVLQFNCNSTDIKDQFVYYMERKYTVASVNQYGSVDNTDGTTTHEFGITIM